MARKRTRRSNFIDDEAGVSSDDDDIAQNDNNEQRTDSPTAKRQCEHPDALDADTIRRCNVPELKAHLQSKGLPTTGKKIDLQARLLAALESGTTSAPQPPETSTPSTPHAHQNSVPQPTFSLEDFFGTPTQPRAAPAMPSTAPKTNLTMVGFQAQPTGAIGCLDTAFAAEFKARAGTEFASTKASPGATNFSFSKTGEISLTRATIIKQCNNDAQRYMADVVEPLLRSHGFRAVVNGEYKKVEMVLNVRREPAGPVLYRVTGDTAYVHFEGVYNFKLGRATGVDLRAETDGLWCGRKMGLGQASQGLVHAN